MSAELRSFTEINFKKLYVEILFRKAMVIAIVAVTFLIAFLYAHTLTPSYKSSVLLKVEQNSGAISEAGNLSSLLSNIPFIGGGQATPAEFEKTLIGSRFIIGKVVDRLSLDIVAKPRYFPLIGKLIYDRFDGAGVAKPLLWMNRFAWGGQEIQVESLSVASQLINKPLRLVALGQGKYVVYGKGRQKLVEGVVGQEVSSSKYHPLLKIKVTALDAKKGNQFIVEKNDLDKVLERLGKHYSILDPGAKGRSKSSGLLEVTYSSPTPSETIEFLNTLANTAYASGVKLLAQQAAQTLTFLNRQLPKTQEILKHSEEKLSDYQAKTGNVDITQQFQYMLKELSSRQKSLEELRLEKSDLLQKYTPKHPYVTTLNQKINEVSESIRQLEVKMHQLPISDKESVELLRNVKANNKLYLALLAKQQELNILKAGVRSNVKILNYASEPPLMVKPKRGAVYILGLMLGLFLSIGIVIFQLITSDKVTDVENMEAALGVAVQSVLPYSDKQKKVYDSLGSKAESGKNILAESFSREILVETMRSLRAGLQVELMQAESNIVSIMSMLPAAGKSFVCLNLAYLFSELGMKVLLIDADMRKGYLHRYFGIDSQPGLSQVLKGEVGYKDVLHKYKSSTLSFMPRGQHTNNASELISMRFNQLLHTVKKDYDLVFVDTAPVNLVADGIVAAASSGVNLLLIPSGLHSIQEISRCLNMFSKNNLATPVVVMNLSSKKTEKKYSYYQQKYYGYNSENYGYYE